MKNLGRKKIKSKVGRPRGRNYIKITISLPKNLLEVIDTSIKGEKEMNRSQYITRILEGYIYYKDKEIAEAVKRYKFIILPIMSFLSFFYDLAKEKGKEITWEDIGKVLAKVIKAYRTSEF